MIKDKQIAAEIYELMQTHYQQLNESVIKVMEQCSEEEFKAYRLAVGHILGEEFFQVIEPLYKEHPELKPEGWDEN